MSLKGYARPVLVVTAMAALGAIVAAAGAPPASSAEEEAPLCCVANPRYAGICAVDLVPEETCQDVLDYLNNAASVGKTYCGGTNVRGGWAEVQCQDDEG